jgi:hypothetical protein
VIQRSASGHSVLILHTFATQLEGMLKDSRRRT